MMPDTNPDKENNMPDIAQPKMSLDDILSGNVRKLAEENAVKDLLLPIKHLRDITYVPPTYLVDGILIEGSVGFISASPGARKTWFAWDMALSIATGTKCMGVHNTKKGSVLAFNAEDSPGAITKPRLNALANARGLKLDEIDDLAIIDVATLRLDDDKQKEQIRATVEYYRPSLLILDPIRQMHFQNEDKSNEMAPILSYLRGLQRDYGVTVLLVVHERKGGSGSSMSNKTADVEGRREDRTRGSNVLEGWRDTAIYLDPTKDMTKVQVYHRGYLKPDDFYYSLRVEHVENELVEAELVYKSIKEVEISRTEVLMRLVWDAVGSGCDTSNKVCQMVGGKKKDILNVIQKMEDSMSLVRQSKKLVQNEFPKSCGKAVENDVF